MDDSQQPDILVQRLHSLAVQHGLTIKQMAEKSGVPKSSLEGYMRLKGAKRPGIDAVISIADSMGVSIDWLVGRSEGRQIGEEERRRIAMAMYRLTVDLLNQINSAQEESDRHIVKQGKIGLYDIEDFAAQTMLHFLAKEQLFPATDFDTLRVFDDLFQSWMQSDSK